MIAQIIFEFQNWGRLELFTLGYLPLDGSQQGPLEGQLHHHCVNDVLDVNRIAVSLATLMHYLAMRGINIKIQLTQRTRLKMDISANKVSYLELEPCTV